jgi:hypothetical protein
MKSVTLTIIEGKQYRFTSGSRTKCQVLHIDPGKIPVWHGSADLVIGILDGHMTGRIMPFGTLERFRECVVTV